MFTIAILDPNHNLWRVAYPMRRSYPEGVPSEDEAALLRDMWLFNERPDRLRIVTMEEGERLEATYAALVY